MVWIGKMEVKEAHWAGQRTESSITLIKERMTYAIGDLGVCC